MVVVLLMMFRCDGDERRDCAPLRATYGEASAEYQNCLRSARAAAAASAAAPGRLVQRRWRQPQAKRTALNEEQT